MPLPLASHRQRQAAAGFAVEELIAEPLEASHVVLGPELGRGEYLVVVVAHREMAVWAGRAAPGQRLVPDVLALPVPAAGCCSVREAGGRVLVRRADGTGYATRAEHLEAFWRADGAPQVVLYGGRLPEQVPVSAPGLMPAGADAGGGALRPAAGRACPRRPRPAAGADAARRGDRAGAGGAWRGAGGRHIGAAAHRRGAGDGAAQRAVGARARPAAVTAA